MSVSPLCRRISLHLQKSSCELLGTHCGLAHFILALAADEADAITILFKMQTRGLPRIDSGRIRTPLLRFSQKKPDLWPLPIGLM